MTSFIYHTDSGHGWLEVDHRDLAPIGLKETEFSRYSYKHGSRLFLEEDCDMPRFIRAYEAKHGSRFECETAPKHYRDHPIRNYGRIPGATSYADR